MVNAKGKTLGKEGGYEMLRGVVKILNEVVREGHQCMIFDIDWQKFFIYGFLEIGYTSECLPWLVFLLKYISFWVLVFHEWTGEVNILQPIVL